MTEVREITRGTPICARSVIKASVIPSEKYSCEGSPLRFSNGSTASDWIRRVGLRLKEFRRGIQFAANRIVTANARPATIHIPFEERCTPGDVGTRAGAID